MKFALAALLVLIPTFAHAAKLTCDTGNLDSDSALRITLDVESRSGAVMLEPWEAGYKVPASKIVKNGNSIAIVGQKITGWAEGDKQSRVVDALFVYHPETKKLTATLLFDGQVNQAATEMDCK